MDLELVIKLAARMRELSEPEFDALQSMIYSGEEDDRHIAAVAQCLSDCCDISNDYEAPKRETVLKFAI